MSSLANNYSRRKISFKKGKGSFLYSYKGEKYLDFIQGIAVNSLGHSNPYLNKALYYQSKEFGMFQMLLKYLRRNLQEDLLKKHLQTL